MNVHVVTACTRPENLPQLAASIPPDCIWHIGFDPDHEHVGGQAVKNRLLDQIHDGWVYILDDDTIMHPDLLDWCRTVVGPDTQAVAVNMELPGGVLHAHPNPAVGSVDIGQVVIRRSYLAGKRLPETYEGDGELLSELLTGPNIVYLDETLAYYNKLR